MVVAGAKRTIIYQEFGVQMTTLEGGAKTLVFSTPNGDAHVFSLQDEVARDLSRDLAPIAATPQDLANIKRGANGRPG